MPPIVVLGDFSPTTRLLVNEVSTRFEVSLVIFEHQPLSAKLRLLQRRCNRLGTWRILQQVLFLFYDRLVIRPISRERITGLLKGHDISPHLGAWHVQDINAPEVVAKIREIRPMCGVVSGTSILRRPLIESFPHLLNIHCGITPRYRGVHGAFWAAYESRPDLAGVTIHQIDAGVDTGDIVAQAIIEVERDDTYRTLPIKQYLKGIPLMIQAVRDALADELRSYRRTDLESKLWYSPTIREYREFQRRTKTLIK